MKDEYGRDMARLGDTTDHGGEVIEAALDAAGQAGLSHAPDGTGSIRFGPDSRTWEAKVEDLNLAHSANWTDNHFAASASQNRNGAL